MKNKNTRWALAQGYEKNWWNERSSRIDFEFYERFAAELKKYLKDILEITSYTSILEIGSGAGGIVTYLKESNNRYAVDPLEKFYSTISSFREQRDKNVKYFSEKGENLPFESKMFDLVIMDNVLDHCDDPQKVMREVKRVLKEKGVLYFKQNTYHLWGRMIRLLMEVFLIDKGHPFTFSKRYLSKLMFSNGFKFIKSGRNGFYTTWKKELLSKSKKDKLKAILFVTRDKVTYLLKSD